MYIAWRQWSCQAIMFLGSQSSPGAVTRDRLCAREGKVIKIIGRPWEEDGTHSNSGRVAIGLVLFVVLTPGLGFWFTFEQIIIKGLRLTLRPVDSGLGLRLRHTWGSVSVPYVPLRSGNSPLTGSRAFKKTDSSLSSGKLRVEILTG